MATLSISDSSQMFPHCDDRLLGEECAMHSPNVLPEVLHSVDNRPHEIPTVSASQQRQQQRSRRPCGRVTGHDRGRSRLVEAGRGKRSVERLPCLRRGAG